MTYRQATPEVDGAAVPQGSDYLEFTGLFTSENTSEHPAVEGDQIGIRINMSDVRFQESSIHGNLLVTLKFEHEFASCFRMFPSTPMALVENVLTGEAESFSLLDPNKIFPVTDEENFLPARRQALDGFVTYHRNIPIALPYNPYNFEGQLYVRVVLHEHTSNVIQISSSAELQPTLNHFLQGDPYTLIFPSFEMAEDDSDTEGDDDDFDDYDE